MADRCFTAAWLSGHVKFPSGRHYLHSVAAGHGIAAFRPLLPARALRRDDRFRGPGPGQPPRRERVENTMANRMQHAARGRLLHVGAAAALALALGTGSL